MDWNPYRNVAFENQTLISVPLGSSLIVSLRHGENSARHLLEVIALKEGENALAPNGGQTEKDRVDIDVPGEGTYRIYHASKEMQAR